MTRVLPPTRTFVHPATRHSGRKQSQRPISYPVLNSVLPQRPDSSTDDVIEAVLRDQQATPDLDDRLGFLQANVNKNWDRLNDLFEHVKSLDRAPAFIAIQDPPYDFATDSKRERAGYWCEAQHGWPKLNSKDEVELENNVPVLASSRVAFYVHKSLALASWSVEWDRGANEHYVASLSLDLVGGDRIKVFNAYNRTRNTIAFNLLLREAVADYCILLGDFNLRHRAWSDRHISDRATKQLEIETRLAGMRCLLKPKDFTFKRGETQTTIDLVFLGERLKDLCELFHVARPRGFTTDHAVLETVLNVSPDRDHTPVLQIDKADPDVVRSEMATRLLAKFGDPSHLRQHQLSTTDKLDQFAKAFVVSAKAAIDATIPTIIRNPVGQKPPVRTRVVQERLLREEHALRVLYRQKRGTQAHNYAYAVWLDAVKQTNRFMRIASNVRKRTRSAEQAKDLSSLFAMARSARFYGKIRASPHMPWLKKPDGTACASSEENARCFRDAMWSDTSEERLAPTELPPTLVRSRASAASGHALSTPSRKKSKPKKKKTRKDKETTVCPPGQDGSSSTEPPADIAPSSGSPTSSVATSTSSDGSIPALASTRSICSVRASPGSLSSCSHPVTQPSGPIASAEQTSLSSLPTTPSATCTASSSPSPASQPALVAAAGPGSPSPSPASQPCSATIPESIRSSPSFSAIGSRPGSCDGTRNGARPLGSRHPLSTTRSKSRSRSPSRTDEISSSNEAGSSRAVNDSTNTQSPEPASLAGLLGDTVLGRKPDRNNSFQKAALLRALAKEGPPKVDEDTVSRIIRKLPSRKAAGPDGVPSDVLKMTLDVILPYLVHLFKACYGFAGKSCTKALELIVNTVLNGWCATTTDKKWRTTLLGLDISGAFNHVNRQELIKVFAEKGIPLWALRFVWSFLSDQCTCVKLPGHTSAKFWVNVGIPQGSPLSPILFALFAAPILDILQRQNLGRSRILLGLSYVDDTYIMVCTDDWEKNCRILEECHQKIVDWATPRGLRFDPAKYNVMHFRKPHGDLNAASAPQNIPNLPFLTEENLVKETDEGGLRILGVQVDHQLTWKWQIDQIEEKVRKKLNQLKRMSTSVSGPNLLHMRQLYLSTIRPIISYACPAWFMLGNDSSTTYNFRQPYIHRLDNLQNECLVTVAGAYKKAPTVPLHKELHVDPIAVYLQRVAMSHRARNIFTDDYDLINTTSFPFKREMTFLKSHPYKIDYDHARELVEEAEQQLRESKPGLADATLIDMDPRKRSQVVNRYIREQATLLSEHLWKAYRDRPRPSRTVAYGLRGRPVAAEGKWGAFNLKRFKGLSRAQSSILIQCRTGYIGLKAFLHPKNLADTDMCSCGQDEHTVEHLIFDCPSLASARRNLPIWKWRISRYHAHTRQRRSLDDLLTDFSRAVSTWAIHHFGLDQFAWTDQHMIHGPSKKHSHFHCEVT
ncbi:hypothetical protein GCG54_00006881 [Colletotrichum gloeosporioides]|uniref:Reverse transcriptase domain-containing protein n=1 Tax=Colletotrichum gloeosporioides TaxID=474922 RepID=A0A8H4FN50_COLGL|nr:uncharacterized protein GCG54_00006881 [Colletotrichum gloeosporioides]KAF3808262.1 hypothetical protein GCG54_00006881 [Colletotrichum gloeosporioides]